MNIKKLTVLLGFAIMISSCGGEKVYYAVIETDLGTMKAELYNSTPQHRDNFIKLANEDFYDGLLFHRVISRFMIQGGDPQSRDAAPNQPLGMGGPGYLIPAEIGAPHFKGTLAAARTGGPGNPEKQSSGSQFYIVHGDVRSKTHLNILQRQKGIAYNETQLAKYEEIGGSPELDMDYTVFGELVDGLDVLDKIASVETNESDRPLKDIKMTVRITTK